MKKTNFTFLKGLALSAFMAVGIANAEAQLACQDFVNVSMDDNCGGTLGPATFSAPGTTPAPGAVVTIKNGTVVLAGPSATITILPGWVGKTYTFEVAASAAPGANKCWGTVKFEDKLGPKFTACPAAPVALTCVDVIPATAPAATDCTGVTSNTYSDVVTGALCTGDLKVVRTWTASDINGNTSTCAITYNIAKPNPALIVYPANKNISACAPVASAYGPDVTGWPGFAGGSLSGSTSALCQMSATYTDKVAPVACGIKIVRTWVLVDWCSGNVVVGTGTNPQIITVEDKTAPTFGATPADITISTSAAGCLSDQLLAPPTATDNCTAPLTYSVSVGGYTFPVTAGKAQIKGLPVGTYVATWKAVDPCGNSATINQNITVKDLINPVAVADLDTKVALTQECKAVVNAITFDDGSLDNCCLDVNRFEVARMGSTNFAPTIEFNKADCGVIVMVQLRVWDCNGNSNIAMVNVIVEDKIAPVAFGRDTNVCCGSTPTATAWLNNYNLPEKKLIDYPSATNPGWYDNCGAEAKRTQSGTIDNCGNGTVTHAYIVTDLKNKTTATANVRYISENRSAYMVEFPDDVELQCNSNKTYGTTPASTGSPIITAYAGTCPLVGVEYKDEIFKVVPDACFKIVRTWKVLNWCQPLNLNPNTGASKTTDPKNKRQEFRKFYNIDVLRPDRLSSVFTTGACQAELNAAAASYPVGFDTDGYMEYKQIIKVTDTTIPTITAGTVGIEAVGKECAVNVTVGAGKADDCTGVTSVTYAIVNAANVTVASGVSGTTKFGEGTTLPFGKYTVRYTATDNCGNYSSTDVAIDVKDAKKPTPICYYGLSVDLMPTTGNVMISCNLFNAGSYDNCELDGCFIQYPAPGAGADVTKLTIDATANGMTTKATPNTLAKNVMFECVGAQSVALWVKDKAGNWDYCETYIDVQNNMGAPNVPNCPKVGGTTNATATVAGAVKTESGKAAQAQVSVNSNVFAKANINWTSANGLSNAVLAPAGTKVEVSAANNTNPLNGVSTLDLVLISKHILGTQTISSKYAKIAADVNNNGSISTADLVELRKMILGIQSNFNNNKSWRFFTANMSENVSMDLQNDAIVDFTAVKIGDINGNADLSTAANRSTVNFNVADANLTAGQEVTVTLNNKEVEGFQFAMNYSNDLEVVSIDENSAVIANGTITTAQVGTDFAVTFKAKKDVKLSSAISLGTAISNEAVVNGTSANVAINFNNTVAGFELAQNQPNPFRGATVISFSTPVAGEYTLNITDMAGRTVQSINGSAVKGLNNVNVEMTSAGVFNYTVKTSNFTATKKMVVIE